VAVAIVVLPLPGSGSAASHPSQVTGYGGLGPVADWLDDVIEELEEIAEDLEDAKAIVGNRSGPPLDEPDKSTVAIHLDSAVNLIDRILDPGQYPSLEAPDAGSLDASVDPETLAEYAGDSHKLAQEALDEAKGAVDDEVLGSRLKTIKNLIERADPHNYRTKAGISTQ
jgi:hypothetical protein